MIPKFKTGIRTIIPLSLYQISDGGGVELVAGVGLGEGGAGTEEFEAHFLCEGIELIHA